MAVKYTFLMLSFSILAFSQNVEKSRNVSNSIELQNQLNLNNTNALEIDRLKNSQENTARAIQDLKDDFHRELDTYKIDQKEKLTQYFIYITLFFGFIGWCFNFFGKRAVKDRVEEIIKSTAQNYATQKVDEILNSTITEEYTAKIIREKGEPEINRLLAELESRGMGAISTFQQKGNEVINEVWAGRITEKNTGADSQILSDEDIKQSQDLERSEEFFNLAFNTKDPKIKIKLYQNVLETQPNNVSALNNIGAAFNDANKYEDAIKFLSKAIELNPNFGLAFSNRAHAYNQTENLELAMNDVNSAIEVNPLLENAYSIKGNIYTKQSKMVEAEAALTTAIEINPNSPAAYFNRGYFNEEVMKYEKSLKDYLKAEDLGYTNKALLYNNIAVAYRRLKKFDLALEYIEKARQNNPDLPNIDGTTALIHADLGEAEEFYKYLKLALEKGCPVWNYLNDPGFDNFREEPRLSKLIEAFKNPHV